MKRKKIILNYNEKMLLLLLGIIILIFLPIIYVQITSSYEISYFKPSDNLIQIDKITVDGNVVSLSNNCDAIIAATSDERAESIKLGIEEKMGPRPNTHDDFVSVINNFDIDFEAVMIYDMKNSTYLSYGVFRQNMKVLELDMKPSDAIALAVRTKTPIYVDSDVMEEYGRDIC